MPSLGQFVVQPYPSKFNIKQIYLSLDSPLRKDVMQYMNLNHGDGIYIV